MAVAAVVAVVVARAINTDHSHADDKKPAIIAGFLLAGDRDWQGCLTTEIA
jgi:hypothetical protein